ncbi:hypothetical protein OROGR_004471 [Orobanche gracilis]
MIPRFGSLGNDIPMETQLLLLEVRPESVAFGDSFPGQNAKNTFYVLFLPVLEGQFRTTLQGNSGNELEFCVESGDAHVQTTEVFEAVFINSGNNPFELITDSFRILERHKGTFTHIKHKMKPTHLDWFGWCTWDAFYKDVTIQGIKEGLESFLEGGCLPKFLIIDDGWQDTFNEFHKEGEAFADGTQFASRLIDLKESSEFMGSGVVTNGHDLHDLVQIVPYVHTVSDHYTAEFHGAARALGGCPVYVSDKLGMHDFKVLKKLVLPDGSILRANCAGRPTRDCLFLDTVMDGKSLLKIWNLNMLSGVVGVFNCQGAGNWPMRDGLEHNSSSFSNLLVLSGRVSPQDIDFLQEVADRSWNGDCAVYAFHTERRRKEGGNGGYS